MKVGETDQETKSAARKIRKRNQFRLVVNTTMRVLIIYALYIVVVSGFCFGLHYAYNTYSDWHRDIIPTAPVPEGARLVGGDNPSAGYWSSQTRNWYYEEYSVPLSAHEVEAFYSEIDNDAEPFGWFSVEILSSEDIEHGTTTIILLEVSWYPDPWPFGAIGL